MGKQRMHPQLKASQAHKSQQELAEDNSHIQQASPRNRRKRSSKNNKTRSSELFQPRLTAISEVKPGKTFVGHIKPFIVSSSVGPSSWEECSEFPRSPLPRRRHPSTAPISSGNDDYYCYNSLQITGVVSPGSSPPSIRRRLPSRNEDESSCFLTERFQRPDCDPFNVRMPQRQPTLSASSLAELQQDWGKEL
eukprot:scaffold2871_cov163-Amphora_coffeaeformis.AAC.2